MTFETWWENYESSHMADKNSAQDAWDDAIKEAAKICRKIAITQKSIYGGSGYNEACSDVAEVIMEQFKLEV